MRSPRRHRNRSQCSVADRRPQGSSQKLDCLPGGNSECTHCDLPPESPESGNHKHGICPNTSAPPPFGEADLEMPLSISFLDSVMAPCMINKSDYQFTSCATVMCFNAPLKMCGPARPSQSDDSDSSCEASGPRHNLRPRSWARRRTRGQPEKDQLNLDRLRKTRHLSSGILSKDTTSMNSHKWRQGFTKTAVKVNHLLSLCRRLKDGHDGAEVAQPGSPVSSQPLTDVKTKHKRPVTTSQCRTRPKAAGKTSHVVTTFSLGSCICHVDRDDCGHASPGQPSDPGFTESSLSHQVITDVMCQNSCPHKSPTNVQHEHPHEHLCRTDTSQELLSVCQTEVEMSDVGMPQSQTLESAVITSDETQPSCRPSVQVSCQFQGNSFKAWLMSQLELSQCNDWNQLLSQLSSTACDSFHIAQNSSHVADSVLGQTEAQAGEPLSMKYDYNLLQMFLEELIITLATENRKMNEQAVSENSLGRDASDNTISHEATANPNYTTNVYKYLTLSTDNSSHQECEHCTQTRKEILANLERSNCQHQITNLDTVMAACPTDQHTPGAQLCPQPLCESEDKSADTWIAGVSDDEATPPTTEQARDSDLTDTNYKSSVCGEATSQGHNMSPVKQTPKKTILVMRKQEQFINTSDLQPAVKHKQKQQACVGKYLDRDKLTTHNMTSSSGSRQVHSVRAGQVQDSCLKASNKTEQLSVDTEADFLAFIQNKLHMIQNSLANKLLNKQRCVSKGTSANSTNGNMRLLQEVFEITKQRARKEFAQWLKSGRELTGDINKRTWNTLSDQVNQS